MQPRRLPDRRVQPLPLLQRKLFLYPFRRKRRNLFCLSFRRKTLNLTYHPFRRKRRNSILHPSLRRRRNLLLNPFSKMHPYLFLYLSSKTRQHLFSYLFSRMHQGLPLHPPRKQQRNPSLQLFLKKRQIVLPHFQLMKSQYRPSRLCRMKRMNLRRSVRLIPKLHLGMEQPCHK